MARTFVLDHSASDFTDLTFDHRLVDAVGTAGSDSLSAGQGNGTAAGSYTTDAGIPNHTGGAPTGTYTVELNITGASSGVNISCRLVRRNAAGVFQAGTSFAADQSAGTTGVKTFSFVNPLATGWSSTDRFGINVRITNTNAHGGEKTVTWETLTVDAEVVTQFAAPTVTQELAGNASMASDATGDLTVTSTHELAGSASAAAGVTGDLTVTTPGVTQELAGSASAAASASGDLTVTEAVHELAGSAPMAASATGDLTITEAIHELAGSAPMAAGASGDLTVETPGAPVELAGSASTAASASGDLTVTSTHELAGASSAAISASGDLTVTSTHELAGSTSAAMSATGDLTVQAPVTHELEGSVPLVVTAVGALEEAVFILEPPTFEDTLAVNPHRPSPPGTNDRLFQHLPMEVGRTIIRRQDGTFYTTSYPSQDELNAASRYYLGGHVHELTPEERADLVAAGYEEFITA